VERDLAALSAAMDAAAPAASASAAAAPPVAAAASPRPPPPSAAGPTLLELRAAAAARAASAALARGGGEEEEEEEKEGGGGGGADRSGAAGGGSYWTFDVEGGAPAAPSPALARPPPLADEGRVRAELLARMEAHDAARGAAAFGAGRSNARQRVALGLWRALQRGGIRDAGALAAAAAAPLPPPGVNLGSFLERAGAAELAASPLVTAEASKDVAAAVEGALFERHCGTAASDGGSSAASAAALPAAYADGARVLISALQDARSGALRARLLCGELAPAALAALPASALAPPEEVAAEAAAARAVLASHDAASGAAWLAHESLLCPACSARGGSRYRLTRGAAEERDIRKAEVWGTSAPAEEASVECECDCGHKWEEAYRSVLSA
jgi:hypothetical protein